MSTKNQGGECIWDDEETVTSYDYLLRVKYLSEMPSFQSTKKIRRGPPR